MFQGLWCEADREGRLADEPVELKIRLLPLDQIDVEAALATLDRAGLIQRYASEGGRVILVSNFMCYQ
ncbi:MAG: hypothetical protein NTV51_03970 [Verrucomicrobia bacterium]|nr:hypothetical protein [Verrucomicrobiota bacterium]